MYRHPKTMNAFFTMMEKFDRAIYDWESCIEIRISDHSPKYSAADKNIYWEDYKNPVEVLDVVKRIIIEN